MKLLHISDTHNYIPPWLKDYDGTILLTGDVSDNGYQKEFDALYKELEPVKDRLIMVPGNHDYGFKGTMYDATTAKRFDEFSMALQNHKFINDDGTKQPIIRYYHDLALCIVGLNSCSMTYSPFDFAQGSLDNQLDIVQKLIDDKDGNMHGAISYILMFHHHPFLHTTTAKMKDANKLYWFAQRNYPRVNTILFGHNHVPDIWDRKWRLRILSAGAAIDNEFMACTVKNPFTLWHHYDNPDK